MTQKTWKGKDSHIRHTKDGTPSQVRPHRQRYAKADRQERKSSKIPRKGVWDYRPKAPSTRTREGFRLFLGPLMDPTEYWAPYKLVDGDLVMLTRTAHDRREAEEEFAAQREVSDRSYLFKSNNYDKKVPVIFKYGDIFEDLGLERGTFAIYGSFDEPAWRLQRMDAKKFGKSPDTLIKKGGWVKRSPLGRHKLAGHSLRTQRIWDEIESFLDIKETRPEFLDIERHGTWGELRQGELARFEGRELSSSIGSWRTLYLRLKRRHKFDKINPAILTQMKKERYRLGVDVFKSMENPKVHIYEGI